MRLGIDFGTSTTVAVTGDGRAVLFDGVPLLPSGICAAGDRLITGGEALGRASITPDAYEPHPKRRVDEGAVLLGDFTFPVATLFAAVLGRAAEEATVATGEPVTALVLTHPASWGADRQRILADAAREAGLPVPELLPEPVAAVRGLPGPGVPDGGSVLVYDFGGGTFDATVLVRTGAGLTVVATESLPDAGGLAVDEALLSWLTTSGHAPAETWQRLLEPRTSTDRRAARRLRDDIRTAKETLSGTPSATLRVPLVDRDVVVTRQQLETLAAPIVDRTVASCGSVLRAAGTGAPAAVVMTGGSSRMPLAGTRLHQALGVPPVRPADPDLAAATGAVLGPGGVPVSVASASGSAPGPAPMPGTPVPAAPVSGMPVPATPVSGMPVSGTPVPATPLSGMPVSGTPISATPVSGTPVSGTAAFPPAERDSVAAIRRWAIVAGAAAAVAAIAAAAALLLPGGDDTPDDRVALPSAVSAAPGQGSVTTGQPRTSASPSPTPAAPTGAVTSAPAAAATTGPAAPPPARSATFAVPETLCPAVRYGAVTALVGEQVSAPVRSSFDPTIPELRTCQVDFVSGGFQALAISLGSEAEAREYMTGVREFEAGGGGIEGARPELTERDAAALGVGQESFSFAAEAPHGTRTGLVLRNGNLVMEFEIYGYDPLVKDRSKRDTVTNAMARAVRETLPQLRS
ncbi:hypothetical protein JCM9533A_05830 [Catenuloplanes niger JCM 9533]|uniref:Molecular chaperone n=1 Tax=Catenuloplanes niger TaxID=587534 RepID=A0AAE4CX37_9ACTN|nr:Hsp70 family protein [Catenuloplanes niger]MDR7327072.1 hypothetical protein [Catenuloplanes niger]